MPLTVDSSGGAAFDYSAANVNRTNATKNKIEETPEKKIAEPHEEQRATQELPQEEIQALFSNRQDSQLNRDILNTFASNRSDEEHSEFSIDNLDTLHKILEKNESEST